MISEGLRGKVGAGNATCTARLWKDVPVQNAADPQDAPAAGTMRGSAGRRTGLVTIDQALSSGSNVLLLIYVAHVVTPIDFGRFSVVMLVATLAQGLVRSLVSLPVLVHPEDADHRPRAVLGSAVLLAVAFDVVCLLAGALLWWGGSAFAVPTLALAAFLPLLQIHDLGRYLAIARGAPVQAIVLDALWIVLMVAAFVAVHFLAAPTLPLLILGWAGAGGLAALWILVQHGVLTRADLTLAWLRERWDFSWRTLVGNVSANAGALLSGVLMSLVSSPVAVAAVRAAILLGRPGAGVQLAVGASAAADIAREKPDDRGLLRHQRRAMAISALAAAVNLGVLLTLPDVVGRALLGEVWPLIEPLLLPAGLALLALAAQSGVRAALLGRREIRVAMVFDIAGTVVTVGSLVAGAALGDAAGAVWGLVVGQSLTTLLWWGAFLRYLRRPRRTAP